MLRSPILGERVSSANNELRCPDLSAPSDILGGHRCSRTDWHVVASPGQECYSSDASYLTPEWRGSRVEDEISRTSPIAYGRVMLLVRLKGTRLGARVRREGVASECHIRGTTSTATKMEPLCCHRTTDGHFFHRTAAFFSYSRLRKTLGYIHHASGERPVSMRAGAAPADIEANKPRYISR